MHLPMAPGHAGGNCCAWHSSPWPERAPQLNTLSRSSLSSFTSVSSAWATCRRLRSPSSTSRSAGVSAILHSSFCNENAAKCLKDRYFEMASCPHGSQSAQAKLTASAQLKPSEKPPWYAFGLQYPGSTQHHNTNTITVHAEAGRLQRMTHQVMTYSPCRCTSL
jgi:hypothetical protein